MYYWNIAIAVSTYTNCSIWRVLKVLWLCVPCHREAETLKFVLFVEEEEGGLALGAVFRFVRLNGKKVVGTYLKIQLEKVNP